MPASGPAIRIRPSGVELATGFVTVFFDTLGIGSFATTTAIFRAMRLVPDELIPGTLNVGHTIESVLSAFVFINLVPVAPVTLISMVVASALGAWFGSGVVSQLPRQRIRYGMGVALTVAATLMLMSQLRLLPSGGDAMGLQGGWLIFAVACNFVLGSLMTLGIGLYAPCMIVVCLLGMNPKAAFPIMMGSCAGLMPMAAVRFVRADRYSPSACRRTHAWRHPRALHRRLPGEVPPARRHPLARHRRRALHGRDAHSRRTQRSRTRPSTTSGSFAGPESVSPRGPDSVSSQGPGSVSSKDPLDTVLGARIYSLCANFFAPRPMPTSPMPDLTRRESQIMEILYRRRRASVEDVRAELPDAPGPSSVRKLLDIMIDRGLLEREYDGPRFVYFPAARVEQASRSALKQIIKTFFDNSPGSAMAALLDMSSDSLSDDEYKRLSALLKRGRKGDDR